MFADNVGITFGDGTIAEGGDPPVRPAKTNVIDLGSLHPQISSVALHSEKLNPSLMKVEASPLSGRRIGSRQQSIYIYRIRRQRLPRHKSTFLLSSADSSRSDAVL